MPFFKKHMDLSTVKKTFSFSLKASLLALISWSIAEFCLKQTRGFTILGVSSCRPFHKEWECRPLTSPEKEEFDRAVSQKYTFFKSGGQSFVFLSQDGNYVIKFFSQKLYYLPWWLKCCPFPWAIKKYMRKMKAKRADKLVRDFASYKAAFEDLEDIGSLVFVHLNQTDSLKKDLVIVDNIGIQHQIPLDRFDFVIQRKAELVYDWISSLMKNGREQEAKDAVAGLVKLVVGRCNKGYRDRDPQIDGNCGFINGKAIKIDVGRFEKDEKMKDRDIVKKEADRIFAPFQEWLKNRYPSLHIKCEEELAILN